MRVLIAALAMLAFLVPRAALATTQISESIFIDGQKHPLFTSPLESYYGKNNPRPPFKAPHTALWRGYVGTWEIDRGVLYLKAIKAWTPQGQVGLEALFPGHKGRVAATWFTGQLRVPQGKIIKPYVPHPIYEKYLMITVEKGRVVKREVVDNGGGVRPPSDDHLGPRSLPGGRQTPANIGWAQCTIRHGLVSRVKNWPYSTFNRFVRQGIYPDDGGGNISFDSEDNFGE